MLFHTHRFVPDDQVLREWVSFSADLGAIACCFKTMYKAGLDSIDVYHRSGRKTLPVRVVLSYTQDAVDGPDTVDVISNTNDFSDVSDDESDEES